MKLNGRRQSSNVDDRRRSGFSGRTAGIGGGIIGVVILAVVTFLSGGDASQVLSNISTDSLTQSGGNYEPTAEEDAMAEFASQILASTEDVWAKVFREQGWGEYEAPKMVLFHGAVQSACGNATSQTGPFYCSGDQTVYIDLDFFKDMQSTIGGGGDFAYAYVIAHEVGHHVQYLRGDLQRAHNQMNRLSEKEANKISVRLELQADFYAGLWAHQENKMFNSLEPGDIEEAVDVAGKIGDDYLQKKAYGRTMPDSFNHGTSSQRSRWLKRGIDYGNPSYGDTFSPSYSSL